MFVVLIEVSSSSSSTMTATTPNVSCSDNCEILPGVISDPALLKQCISHAYRLILDLVFCIQWPGQLSEYSDSLRDGPYRKWDLDRGVIFNTLPKTTTRTTQPPVKFVPGFPLRLKRPKLVADHPALFSAGLRIVRLYTSVSPLSLHTHVMG